MTPEMEVARQAIWEATRNSARITVAGAQGMTVTVCRELFNILGLDGECPPYMAIDIAPDPGKNLARTVDGVFYE